MFRQTIMTQFSRSQTADGGTALPVDGEGLSAHDQKGEDMKRKHWTIIVPGAVLLCATPAFGVELRDAIQSAMQTNPEIRQAVHNKLATKEERKQSEGMWYPRISVEGSAGVRDLENPTRRSTGIADETLHPVEGFIVAD